ncbi:MAG: NUDIX hydrolase [bacterium]|nr:NUDIX hydrolase [bacterium]
MEEYVRCPNCKSKVLKYKNPAPTADVVAIRDSQVLMILRRNPPEGWALPGGFIEYGETAEHAAARELHEETGLLATSLRLVGVYSDPERDTRYHTITVAFAAEVSGRLEAGDDALDARWFPLDALPEQIAFDHRKVINDAL